MTETQKGIIKGIFAIALYFICNLTNLNVIILKILHIDYSNWSSFMACAYLIIFQLILLLAIFFMFKDTYIKNFKEYKNNFKNYMNEYIKYWFIALGLMIVSNLIINLIASGIAPNEQGVRDMLDIEPLYTFISAVILAPLLEESIFRLAIRKIIPHQKWIFILVSGLFFGLLHVIGNVDVWTDWLYLLPYSVPGLVFAYTLTKSNNIFVPISLHFIHNFILITIQLLAI